MHIHALGKQNNTQKSFKKTKQGRWTDTSENK
jgi:hypothetical protein